MSSSTYQYITGTLIPDSINFFQQTLQVVPYPTNIILNGSKCYEATIPTSYKSGTGVAADTILFVTAVNDPFDNYAAWAAYCSLSPYDQRQFIFILTEILFD